jgi:hypothetical protein
MMVTFGIVAQQHPFLQAYLEDTDERLQNVNMITNPFKGFCKVMPLKKPNILAVIKIDPIYMDVSLIGILGILGIYMIWGFTWWMLPFILIALSHYFYTTAFYVWMFKKGLIKTGYKPAFQVINPSQIVELMLVN